MSHLRPGDTVRITRPRCPVWTNRRCEVMRGRKNGLYLLRRDDGKQEEFRREELCGEMAHV